MQEQQMDDERRDDERRDDEEEGRSTAEGRMATATASERAGEDRMPAATGVQRPTSEPAAEKPLDLQGYRTRWDAVQAGFVDDPRAAAEQADEVVSELLHRLQERRERLHAELGSGDTETMRQAIRQYRDLFHALARE